MRRLLKIFALLLALLILLIASVPYWVGALLPSIGKRFGTTYGAYSRVGYSRFALNDVVVRRSTVTVHVDRLEADTPLLWAVRHLRRADRAINATAWKVEVVSHGSTHASDDDSGWIPLDLRLRRIVQELDRWLPRATVGPGQVSWPGGGLSLISATWQDRALHADGLRWREDVADVVASFPVDAIRVDAALRTRPLKVRAESRSATVSGEATLFDQTAPFEFKFDQQGWLPASGTVTAKNWRVPAQSLKLGGYTDITGSATATWLRGEYDVSADLHGKTAEKRGAPDLHVIARAHGDRAAYAIEQLDVSAPGIQARLSAPIRAKFQDSAGGPPSVFTFAANLAEIPWFKAEGRLEGDVHVEPRAGAVPIFQFSARADNVTYPPWNATSLSLRGHLDWPKLAIDAGEISGIENAHLSLVGACDFRAKEILSANAVGRVTAALIQPWLPKNVTFGSAIVALKADGPWGALKHEGTVQLEQLSLPGLVPAEVNTSWHGTGAAVEEGEASIHAGATQILASGALQHDGARLTKLVWRQAQQERLSLQRPSEIRWTDGIQVDAFDLVGRAGEMHLSGNWGERGEVRLSARGIAGEWWRDFVPPAPFEWSIDTFSVHAKWDRGPAVVDTTGKIFIDLPGRARATLDLAAHADAGGVTIERLRTLEDEKEFATVQGKLPVAVWAAPKPHVDIGRTADLAVTGHVDPNARWWIELGQRTGVKLDRPDLTFKLDGSWEQPRGSATLDVAGLRMDKNVGANPMPSVENVHVQLTADGAHLKLDPVQATIQGQPISLAAVLPTDRQTWEKLRKDPLRVLRDEVEISLRATDTDVAAFAPYASGILLPQGHLDADITLSTNGAWKGFLRLRNLGTRPMGTMGPLRDISADLELENRRVVVKKIETAVAGQTLNAEGFVELPVGGQPRFDFKAKGENLPFVRQAGLIVRGDVNLKVATVRDNAPPIVSGDVILHDGLFLSDVRALVPRGGPASPERRPPYFSIDAEPFRHWRLDVNVRGNRFLRARTTLFNGLATTKFHLVGTLGDPRALGELRVEEGQVMFPFARFALQDATVRLSEENPYDPQLAIFGTSQRYGYDLKVEVTGAASSPLLVFSSNPPLSSEQVLLLVMAGETPKNEVTYSTNQRFARLGTYFGQSLLSSLGGGTGGDDRLTISSGERVSRQGRETYDVEYKLNDRWAAVGEYDEFDEYNLGLKWRAMPKKLRGDTNENR